MFNSGQEGDLYFYSKEGRYQSKINRKGDGPEEYSYASGYWIEDDQLCVYASKSGVKCYDFQGNFKKGLRLENGSQLLPCGDGSYAMDMGGFPVQDSLKYRIVKYNPAFEKDTLLLPFERTSKVNIYMSSNGLNPYKDGMTYLRSMNDTLYYLLGNEVAPMMHFDLGSDWLWKDEQLRRDQLAGMKAIDERKDMVWNVGVYLHQKWAYLSLNTGFDDSKDFLLDRTTGAYRQVNFRKKGEEQFGISGHQWTGDLLLMTIASEDVADFLAELGEEKWRFREGTTLEAIEYSEHRVVMWVKFKSFESL